MHDSFTPISGKTIERMVLYQRILSDVASRDVDYVHSHEIAERVNNSSAQVRRDLMSIGFTGSTAHGYSVRDPLAAIQNLFDQRAGKKPHSPEWASWDTPSSLTGPFGSREPPLSLRLI